MFLDARHIVDGDVLDVDLCVIGAGAAGVALALEFAHTEHTETRVLLLEGGGATGDGDNPGTYRIVPGSTFGLVVDPAQTWYLGGNANHWFGNCRPLDDVDFEPRPWIPHSGAASAPSPSMTSTPVGRASPISPSTSIPPSWRTRLSRRTPC
jgi:choline dehydrogenase-like flavoprotein